jgi:hypothetical protein
LSCGRTLVDITVERALHVILHLCRELLKHAGNDRAKNRAVGSLELVHEKLQKAFGFAQPEPVPSLAIEPRDWMTSFAACDNTEQAAIKAAIAHEEPIAA